MIEKKDVLKDITSLQNLNSEENLKKLRSLEEKATLLAILLTRAGMDGKNKKLSYVAAIAQAKKSSFYSQLKQLAEEFLQMKDLDPDFSKHKVQVTKIYRQIPNLKSNSREWNFVLPKECQINVNNWTPLTNNSIQCPYCHANYDKSAKGQLCKICNMAEVGAIGLKGLELGRKRQNNNE